MVEEEGESNVRSTLKRAPRSEFQNLVNFYVKVALRFSNFLRFFFETRYPSLTGKHFAAFKREIAA